MVGQNTCHTGIRYCSQCALYVCCFGFRLGSQCLLNLADWHVQCPRLSHTGASRVHAVRQQRAEPWTTSCESSGLQMSLSRARFANQLSVLDFTLSRDIHGWPMLFGRKGFLGFRWCQKGICCSISFIRCVNSGPTTGSLRIPWVWAVPLMRTSSGGFVNLLEKFLRDKGSGEALNHICLRSCCCGTDVPSDWGEKAEKGWGM